MEGFYQIMAKHNKQRAYTEITVKVGPSCLLNRVCLLKCGLTHTHEAPIEDNKCPKHHSFHLIKYKIFFFYCPSHRVSGICHGDASGRGLRGLSSSGNKFKQASRSEYCWDRTALNKNKSFRVNN